MRRLFSLFIYAGVLTVLPDLSCVQNVSEMAEFREIDREIAANERNVKKMARFARECDPSYFPAANINVNIWISKFSGSPITNGVKIQNDGAEAPKHD